MAPALWTQILTLEPQRGAPVADFTFDAGLRAMCLARFRTALHVVRTPVGWGVTSGNPGDGGSVFFDRTYATQVHGTFFNRWVQELLAQDVAWFLNLTLRDSERGTLPVVAPVMPLTYTAWRREREGDPNWEPNVALRRAVPPALLPYL